MNKLLAAAIAASTVGFTSAATAGVSSNVGFVSDYFFRGILQADSVASAGIDYEEGGFYAGAWAADVDDGLEIDGYLGYGIEVKGVSLGLGFTTYQYTGDFDSGYNEVNLTAGFGPLSFEYTVGEQDEDLAIDIAGGDYTFFAATYEYKAMYVTYGTYGDESDGDYVEVGFAAEVGGFDAGVAFISASNELADIARDPNDTSFGQSEVSLVFSLGKSFDL